VSVPFKGKVNVDIRDSVEDRAPFCGDRKVGEGRIKTQPGNVFLHAEVTGLPKDSVVNVTAVVTVNKTDLFEQAGLAPLALLREIDRGPRQVLDLWSINAG
jgi:mRNA-degrading endonuclease toxin of MazEF toxin-antitoxin module